MQIILVKNNSHSINPWPCDFPSGGGASASYLRSSLPILCLMSSLYTFALCPTCAVWTLSA